MLIEEREQLRNEIKLKTDVFIANGGRIKHIPRGASMLFSDAGMPIVDSKSHSRARKNGVLSGGRKKDATVKPAKYFVKNL